MRTPEEIQALASEAAWEVLTAEWAGASQAELRLAELKRCPRCGQVKSRKYDFQHRANGSVFSWCRTCNREHRAAKAEEAKAAPAPEAALEPRCAGCGEGLTEEEPGVYREQVAEVVRGGQHVLVHAETCMEPGEEVA